MLELLKEFSLEELREFSKKAELKDYSKLKKDDLITLLIKSDKLNQNEMQHLLDIKQFEAEKIEFEKNKNGAITQDDLFSDSEVVKFRKMLKNPLSLCGLLIKDNYFELSSRDVKDKRVQTAIKNKLIEIAR